MIEVVIIVALLAYIGVKEYLNRLERRDMTNALIAKNASELRDIKLAENTKIKHESAPTKEPDLVPLESATEEEFDKAIKNELEGNVSG